MYNLLAVGIPALKELQKGLLYPYLLSQPLIPVPSS